MIFLIDVPPPIHGMSSINEKFFIESQKSDINIKVINSVPSKFARFSSSKIWIFIKLFYFPWVIYLLLLNFLTRKHKTIYRPINGGVGQFYDLCYLTISRFFCEKKYLHHHSYNYINNKSKLFGLLLLCCDRRNTIHIVLSEDMLLKMSRLYDIPHSSFRVLSNISFFQEAKKLYFDKENILLDRPIRLGHMANLSIEKGLDIFVEICRKLLELDVNFSAIIAGPYASSNSKMLIEDICASTNKVKYIGPVYGTDKEYFFSNIDIFIFPSKYKNEAEPLVIYEAAQYGNLVIGSKQGSIEYMVEKIGGIAFDISNNNNESFLKATVTRIVQLISSKDVIGNKIKIIDKYNEFVRINKKSLLLLLNEFKE